VFLFIGLVAAAGCRCDGRTQPAPPAQLSTDVTTLDFPPTYVGHTARQAVLLANTGRVSASVDVLTAAPFTTTVAQLVVPGDGAESVAVDFAPLGVGLVTGTLTLGSLTVQLRGEGLAVPECSSANPCQSSVFDVSSAACVVSALPEGQACSGTCVVSGQCAHGNCEGVTRECADGDACTVDACGPGGCLHSPVTCPAPVSRCRVARCDAATGCGEDVAPDGTLCGPDDCAATQVDVCIVGQCVRRARPDTGRCANRWVPTTIPARSGHAMAWDGARGRVVLFGGEISVGGAYSDTWEWDGTAWEQRIPASSPPARLGHAMVYDEVRRRVVLFGGFGTSGALSDTWEWDGTTWLQRTPATSPPARTAHALVWDSTRRRVLLFGGSGGVIFSDTWEWDGTTWLQRTPATSPPARASHAMSADRVRQRVVLFGGASTSDTWEWDGTNWAQARPATSPSARSNLAMAWDAARERVVLFGGEFGNLASDTWEWDGTDWVRRLTSGPPPLKNHAMAYDAVRQRVVLFGGFGDDDSFDTWEWDGTTWAPRAKVPRPSSRIWQVMAPEPARGSVLLFGGWHGAAFLSDTWTWNGAWVEHQPATSPGDQNQCAMAYDEARQRVVLLGLSSQFQTETWEWDGTTWVQRTPASSPPQRRAHAMAWDGTRQRVVLFGGDDTSSSRADTWEWDGTTWVQRLPATSPPARLKHAMAWDAARGRVVLFGGAALFDTWEWDGATWLQRLPATSPTARGGLAMVYDSDRQRVVLFGGGETWEWDGVDWWRRRPVTSPSGAMSVAMAWDQARGRMTLFDGSTTWLLLP
jgi:hypothetical protein